MSAAEHPAVIRIRKGRSSDTQLHTAPNSRGPQSEAVRGSARCARSSRRRDGRGQSVGAGCRPDRVERCERGQRPGESGARLRGRLGRVRRAAHGPRGRVVRADPLGLQPGAQHVGRLRADAPRRREPRLCSRGQGPGRRAGPGAGTRCRHARPGRHPDRPAGGQPCAPTSAPTSAAARPSSPPRRSGSGCRRARPPTRGSGTPRSRTPPARPSRTSHRPSPTTHTPSSPPAPPGGPSTASRSRSSPRA